MPISREEIAQAAAMLSKKTGFTWQANSSGVISCSVQLPGNSWGQGETDFKQRLKSAGIDYVPAVLATTRGQIDSVAIMAEFSHPLEIKAMAKNTFTHPPVDDLKLAQAANILREKTGFKWEPNSSGGISCSVHLPGNSWEQGEIDFKQKLKNAGIDYVPEVLATTRGLQGLVLVTAEFSNPSEINALIRDNASSQVAKQRPAPYIIRDSQGDNVVNNVTKYKDERGTGYKIEGANCNGQPRSIIVYDNGVVVNGFDGSRNLGIVGFQMYAQKDALLNYFDYKPNLTKENLLAAKSEGTAVANVEPLDQLTIAPK